MIRKANVSVVAAGHVSKDAHDPPLLAMLRTPSGRNLLWRSYKRVSSSISNSTSSMTASK
jgi:hypothetical protein